MASQNPGAGFEPDPGAGRGVTPRHRVAHCQGERTILMEDFDRHLWFGSAYLRTFEKRLITTLRNKSTSTSKVQRISGGSQ